MATQNANVSSIISINTFDEWRTRTNDLIKDRNTLRNASYVKDESNFRLANGVLSISRPTEKGVTFINDHDAHIGGLLDVGLDATIGRNAIVVNNTSTSNLYVTMLSNTNTLNVRTLANILEANIITANANTLNVNMSYKSIANIANSNTANSWTYNANAVYLTVPVRANIYLANIITANIATLNVNAPGAYANISVANIGGVFNYGSTSINPLFAPTAAPAGTGQSGGSLTASTTYYFKIVVVDGLGNTTTPGPEFSIATTTTNKQISLTWDPIKGAVKYQVWYGTATNSQTAYFIAPSNEFLFTTTTGATTATIPSANTTGRFTMTTLGTQANILNANITTANVATLNVNGDYRGLANIANSNTANSWTMNANAVFLNVPSAGRANIFLGNIITANVATLNVNAPGAYANISVANISGVFNYGSTSINPLSAPTVAPAVTIATGGSLPASTTYYFKIVAVDGLGNTTTPGPESSGLTTSSTNKTITLNWDPIKGAVTYQVWYGTTAGNQLSYFVAPSNNFSFSTTTGATTATIPSANTTGRFTMTTLGTQANILNANITTANVATLNVNAPGALANIANSNTANSWTLNANAVFLTVPSAGRANIHLGNIITANVTSLNVNGAYNHTANIANSNTANSWTMNANAVFLNVPDAGRANIFLGNIITANVTSLNVNGAYNHTANIANSNTANSWTNNANAVFLTVPVRANIFLANITTANIATLNVNAPGAIANIANSNTANSWTNNANVVYLTVPVRANIELANIDTANIATLNVAAPGSYANIANSNTANSWTNNANAVYLTVPVRANIVLANITTANVATLNVAAPGAVANIANSNTANSWTQNAVDVLLTVSTRANIVLANITTSNIATLNVAAPGAVANIANSNTANSWTQNAIAQYLNVLTQANATLANITTANVATLNVNASGSRANIANANIANSWTQNSIVDSLTVFNKAVIELANIDTANVGILNVAATGAVANIANSNTANSWTANAIAVALRVTQANITSGNITTANVATLNVNATGSTANIALSNTTAAYIANAYIANSSTTNAISDVLSVTTRANIALANITTANIASLNVNATGAVANIATANITTIKATNIYASEGVYFNPNDNTFKLSPTGDATFRNITVSGKTITNGDTTNATDTYQLRTGLQLDASGYFKVFRGSNAGTYQNQNAAIKFDSSTNSWQATPADASAAFSSILLTNQLETSVTSTSSVRVATPSSVNAVHTIATSAQNTVMVSANSGSTLYSKSLNFVNTATMNVTVAVNGSDSSNANVSFTANTSAFLPIASISGTLGYIPKFASSTTIGNGIIYDSGTQIGIGTSSPSSYTGTVAVAAAGSITGISLVGTATSGSTNIVGLQFYNYDGSTTSTVGQIFAGDNNNTGNVNALVIRATRAAANIRFDTGSTSTERMRIDSSGVITIASTSRLAVLGTANVATGNIASLASATSSIDVLTVNTTFKAKSFIDLDDETYYVNPAATTRINTLNVIGNLNVTGTINGSVAGGGGNGDIVFGYGSALASGLNGSLGQAALYNFGAYSSNANVPNAPDATKKGSVVHVGDSASGLQIYGSAENSDLYYRKGNGGWGAWTRILTTADQQAQAPTTAEAKKFSPILGGSASGTGMYSESVNTLSISANSLEAIQLNTDGSVTIVQSTASTSTTTGALIVAGGVGVAGKLYADTTWTKTLTFIDTSTIINGIGYINGSRQFVTSNNLTYDGTKLTASGNILAAALIPTSSTVPTNGLYLPVTNRIGFATNSVSRMTIDDAGIVDFAGRVNVNDVTASTSKSTGALVVDGGVGIAGKLYANAIESTTSIAAASGSITGALSISGTTQSTSSTSGALTVAGGVGIEGNLYVAGQFNLAGNFVTVGSSSGSTTTGTLTISSGTPGGVGYLSTSNQLLTSPNLIFDGTKLTAAGNILAAALIPTSSTVPTNGLYLPAANKIGFATNSTSRMTIDSTGTVNILSTTGSTSTTTGALQVAGGVGVAGKLNADAIWTKSIEIAAGGSVNAPLISATIIPTGGVASGVVYLNSSTLQITSDAGFVYNDSTNTLTADYVNAKALVPTGATAPSNGLYLPTTNKIGFATNSALRLTIDSVGDTNITSATNSTSATTGALTVVGGIGVAKDVWVAGVMNAASTTTSTSTTTGALKVAGGVGIVKDVFVGGNVSITSAATSTSTTTGALKVTGGIGVTGDAYLGSLFTSGATFSGAIDSNNTDDSTSKTTGSVTLAGGIGVGKSAYVGGNVVITGTTAATSKTTGALRVAGGMGVAGTIYATSIIADTITGAATAQGVQGTQGTTGYGLWTPVYTGVAQTAPGTYTKTGTNVQWDSSVYSRQGYVRGCYVSASAGQTDARIIFGLNSNPAADALYSSIDFGVSFSATATYLVMENGSVVDGVGGSYTTSDVFTITYDGQNVRYYKNSTVFRTAARAVGTALYFDTSFVEPGGDLTNVAFGPMGESGTSGAQGAQGTQGTTGPVAGTNGQIIYNNGGVAGGDSALIFNDTAPKSLSTPSIIATGRAYTPVSTITFSAAAMSIDCRLSNIFKVTLTGNVTTAPTLSNPVEGQTINIFITQDATGGRTMTWPTSFKWPDGVSGTLTTSGSAVDLIVATYIGSSWYVSLLTNFS